MCVCEVCTNVAKMRGQRDRKGISKGGKEAACWRDVEDTVAAQREKDDGLL